MQMGRRRGARVRLHDSVWHSTAMIGRDAELSAITDAASQVSRRGQALVVEGEAGIGKTTLLNAAAAWARDNGFVTLSCAGVQCQTKVGHAAVHELVHPILRYADALPLHQRGALLAAFGLAEHPMPDPLLIGVAMLGLIEEASAQRPLMLIVDDAQWLDGSSLHVLTFVGRRLMNSPVLLLCAARPRLDGEPARLMSLTRFPLGPVDDATSRTLMADAMAAADRPLTELEERRVLSEACGNPLAIAELTKAVVASAHHDPVFSTTPLPTTRKIERVFLEQLDTIADPSRQLLALISAAADAPLVEVVAAAQLLGLSETHLDPLERAGLVTASDGRLAVRHPLVRSVAYRAAALSQRSAFHRALAETAADPIRAAWQRAAATYGPDEEVATELEAAGRRARRRGANSEATAAFRRAAVLSPSRERRIRRLVSAVEPACRAGLTAEAIDILDEAEPLATDLGDVVVLACARFMMGLTAGVGAPLVSDLVALADRLDDDGAPQQGRARVRILAAAAAQCRINGLPDAERHDVTQRLEALTYLGDPTVEIALATVDDTSHARRFRLRAAAVRAQIDGDAVGLMSMGLAAEAVSDSQTAQGCWDAAVAAARGAGSPAIECQALRGSAQTHIIGGRLHEAAVNAQGALQIAADASLTISQAAAAALLARAQVWRGETGSAEQTLDEARRHLPPDCPLVWADDLAWAAGLLALAARDHHGAFAELSQMTHRSARRWAIADLTEAAVACRETVDVATLVEEIASEAACLGSAYVSMLIHRSRALLAGAEPVAEDHFRAALQDADADAQAPLEYARTQLSYGEWLRRRRRIVDARAQLSRALRAFESRGAHPWAQRTRVELRAAGVQIGGQAPADDEPAIELTPQELEIARLAASGLSNRQIADRIYVSHRTVAAHLYKVFPKLGITSRNQLRDALGINGFHTGAVA